MFRRLAAALLCLPLCAFLSLSCVRCAQATADSSIVVNGSRRTDVDMIRGFFHPRPDGSLDSAALDSALKDLYGTGLFADVKITREGARIVVTVKENPLIDRLEFEGNKKIKDDDLKKAIDSKAGEPLARARVHDDVVRIIDLYREHGYFDAKVEPKTIAGQDDRRTLIFEINEGNKLAVRQIRFVGNSAFAANKLDGVIKTGRSNILSFLLNNDIYDADRIEAD